MRKSNTILQIIETPTYLLRSFMQKHELKLLCVRLVRL